MTRLHVLEHLSVVREHAGAKLAVLVEGSLLHVLQASYLYVAFINRAQHKYIVQE